jgi:prepilin-type N-terminal cleavage/methylation domain-containing protein
MRNGEEGVGGQCIPNSEFRIRHSCRGLTMVELLIVIIVIGVLMSAILVAASGLINKSKTNNTRAMLQVVSDAVEQFKRDQTSRPTIASAKQGSASYVTRYGPYPPDELEVFATGLPGTTAGSLAPGRAAITLASGSLAFEPMRFYKDGTDKDHVEHRDMMALTLAIDLFSDAASAILDRIPDRNRTPGPLAATGNPAIFLDRPDPATGRLNGTWDPGDWQIRYLVDDWGNPISYLSQRDWVEGAATNVESSNRESWNEASTEFVRLNGGQPVIMSYGPDGKDQLTKDEMEPNAKASLVGDFETVTGFEGVDHPLNDDNVYANPTFREKLAKGIVE